MESLEVTENGGGLCNGEVESLEVMRNGLKNTIESVYQKVEEMIHLSKASVYEWQLEQEFKAKIEALVMSNCIWNVRGDMRDYFCDVKNVNWDGKMKEISGIRDELDAISKSLSVSDNVQLPSHGSLEENGIHDEIEINMEEHLDPDLLNRMDKEELISHCKNEITKLKRNHESKIQDLTEQHFSHMRVLLREKGPSLTSKKNKEFDMLRKVISKVDEILVEKEEVDTLLPLTSGSNEESLTSLKDKAESLLSENCQLRDSLEHKKREIKCLSLQISEASANLSQHTLAEEKLLKTVGNLKAAMEDAHFEAVIGEDLFAGIVREVVDEIKCIAEESQVENSVLHGIYKSILDEAFHDADSATKCESEDLNMESIIMQEVCDVTFKDSLKEAVEKLNELNIKYIDEYELRVLHEKEKRDMEEQLKVEVANKERLLAALLILVEEREQSARDAAAALAKEKERYEQKLSVAVNELRQVEEDRRMLCDVNQQKQIAVSLLEAKERELSEKFESMAAYVSGFLKSLTDFECRVTQDISGKCSRLKSLASQSNVLKQKAGVLVRRGILYKQRFEKKCTDLEKAEAEVDILGDQVVTLSNLVEKIYIALDHYSPILQHYPGITDILKLVKRELSPDN